jgi:transcriptional regulator with XRE-family HTH domain
MPDAVGKRIRRLRDKHGLTLRALAAKAGVPTSSINAVEQGTRAGARLSLETGKKLALALGVTLDYLSGMHEELGRDDEDSAPAPTIPQKRRAKATAGEQEARHAGAV